MKKTTIITVAVLICGILAYSALRLTEKSSVGVTVYYPEKCYNGYTLYSDKDAVRLIDMNGRTVNRWPRGGIRRPVSKKGHIIIPRTNRLAASEMEQKQKKEKITDNPDDVPECTIFSSELTEYDWNSNVVWSYITKSSETKLHHDQFEMANDNLLLIVDEKIPASYKEKITDPKRKNIDLHSDCIIEITPAGETVWEWHAYEYLDINLYCPYCGLYDWMHTNSVEELPENALGLKDPRFKAGNILISPRNHNTLYIIDKKTSEVVWSWGSDVLGHPHHPTMLENGNIILFDNGLHGKIKPKKRNISRVLEIDPAAEKIVWKYELSNALYSSTRSNVQKLPNGNVLIYSFSRGIILEVTPEKEIVWKFIGPKCRTVRDATSHAFRIPYDHCPQSAALPKPKEKPVVPRSATGVTLYYPEKCYNGYTLYSGKNNIELIDMNGKIVHTWQSWCAVQPILKNGHIIVPGEEGSEIGKPDKRRDMARSETHSEIIEYDWDGDVVWSYRSKDGMHHDHYKTANGNILLICREKVPDAYKTSIIKPERRNKTIYSDYIIEITPSGETVWEWHAYEYLDINLYCPYCRLRDWTHTNTVEELPENALGLRDPRFKAGNILINPRNLNTLYIIDKNTKEVVWSWGRGVLRHPHQPTMLKNGKIIIFDNGLHDKNKNKFSRILVLDPLKEKIVWQYEERKRFYSAIGGGVQKLPNGNVLICEHDTGRLFEVTPGKKIVWKFINPHEAHSYRAFRVPYDYCPQSEHLPKPKEKHVIPKRLHALIALR
ncbi:MAG: hypothetical protein A2Z72_02110 [Omnitrophica bacterium RBG_13_46_9]|nr:MAG: hypothetical protein A2Z72_02110 [Omnitrophica bacterium RBG_13_46_9]